MGKRLPVIAPKRVKKTDTRESVKGSPAQTVTAKAAANEAIITFTFSMHRATKTKNPINIAI